MKGRADAIGLSDHVTSAGLRHISLVEPDRFKLTRVRLPVCDRNTMNFLDSPLSKPAPYVVAPIEHRFDPYEDNGGYVPAGSDSTSRSQS
jgi:hypothetical protein